MKFGNLWIRADDILSVTFVSAEAHSMSRTMIETKTGNSYTKFGLAREEVDENLKLLQEREDGK
jgi:hypothetical protein